MGIDDWSQYESVNGVCPDYRWGLVCVGTGAGLLTQLHENACHDATLKASKGFGHCTAVPPVPCALHAHAMADDQFCTECQNKMKAEIKAKS